MTTTVPTMSALRWLMAGQFNPDDRGMGTGMKGRKVTWSAELGSSITQSSCTHFAQNLHSRFVFLNWLPKIYEFCRSAFLGIVADRAGDHRASTISASIHSGIQPRGVRQAVAFKPGT